jgi:AcrR family transcriptional regulator
MPYRNHRENAAQKLDEILASGPHFILNHRSTALIPLARHLGLSPRGLYYYVPNETELVRQICLVHLNAAFEAVCTPVDWLGAPIAVLRAMSLALLRYEAEKPLRHLVFLLHRQALHEPARNALDTLLTYLANNFQLALQGIHPDKPFDSLHGSARMLLGELLHLPLWWPEAPHIGKDEWLCHQIGFLAGTPAPDWRLPPANHVDGHGVKCDDWGDAGLPNRFLF